MKHLFDFSPEEIIPASAKMGIGITDILNAIIERMPAPKSSGELPLKRFFLIHGLIFIKGLFASLP